MRLVEPKGPRQQETGIHAHDVNNIHHSVILDHCPLSGPIRMVSKEAGQLRQKGAGHVGCFRHFVHTFRAQGADPA